MAPPFVLEYVKPAYGKARDIRSIYSKNQYNDKVKVEDWQYIKEPSPRNPEHNLGPLIPNQVRPKLSECICDMYKTSYHMATDQLHRTDNCDNPFEKKDLFNYFGYNDDKINPKNFDSRRDFPIIMKNYYNMIPQFVTTMQSSYASPLGIIMQRLRSPEERFMLHRRMKGVENSSINTKFRDDRMEEVNKSIRCARQGQYGISYNPMTGLNNNGTIPKVMSFQEMVLLKSKKN